MAETVLTPAQAVETVVDNAMIALQADLASRGAKFSARERDLLRAGATAGAVGAFQLLAASGAAQRTGSEATDKP